jgi:cyclophilin family peptidyl-prolyl cis-trans isomerase
MPPAEAGDYFVELAEQLGLDASQFSEELAEGVHAEKVTAQMEEATALGLPGTPAVLLNGDIFAGNNLPFAYHIWDALVQLTLLEERQYAGPPPMTVDPESRYLATVSLESGDEFVIELLPQSAPQTVNSFVFLAEEGWFDGVTFHRVLPDFVAQTGDPTGTGIGGPGYTIPNEIDPELSHAEPGVVAMANSGPDTNGSQWYITLGDASFLDGGYTIFGRVIEGLDVVQAITPRDPQSDPEAPPGERIERVTIEVEP